MPTTLFFSSLKILLFPWKKNFNISLIGLSTINSQLTYQKLKKLSSVALAFQINFFHLFFLTFSELIPSRSLTSTCHTLFLVLFSISTFCSLSVIKDYYLFCQLKSQNLSAQCLDIIFQALILSKITYALPAFAGLISATFKSKINKLFNKAHSRGLELFDIQGLIDKQDTHLFRSIAYTDHCLHYLLPEKLNRSRNFRHRGHEYTLKHIRTTQHKNTIVDRCLFSKVQYFMFYCLFISHQSLMTN